MTTAHLEELISELTYRIDELEAKFNELNKQINTNSGFKYGLAKRVDEVEDKAKSIKSDLEDLESRVDDLEA